MPDTYLYVQKPEACGCFIRPGAHFTYDSKPPEMSSVSDEHWNSFRDRVKSVCSGFVPEWLSWIPLVFVLVSVLIIAGAGQGGQGSGQDDKKITTPNALGAVIAVVGGPVGYVGIRCFTHKRNKQQDMKITEACQAFQSECNRPYTQIMVDYETEYTGPCKPRGRMQSRTIVIVSCGSGLAAVVTVANPEVVGAASNTNNAAEDNPDFV